MGETTSDPSTLLQTADGALYRAKAEGRNRVVVSGEGEGSPQLQPDEA